MKLTMYLLPVILLAGYLTNVGAQAATPDLDTQVAAYRAAFDAAYPKLRTLEEGRALATPASYDRIMLEERLPGLLGIEGDATEAWSKAYDYLKLNQDTVTNENSAMSWGLSYDHLSLNLMAQATGDTKYLAASWLLARAIADARDNVRGLTLYTGESASIWGCSKYIDNGRAAHAVHTGMITFPVLELLVLLRDAPDFENKPTAEEQQTVLEAMEAALAFHDRQWREVPGDNEGHYVGMNQEPGFEGVVLPANRQAALGRSLLTAYDLTGKEAYLDKAVRIGWLLKNRISLATDKDAYVWPYTQPLDYAAMQQPWQELIASGLRGEDISHASLTASFPMMLHRKGLVFDAEDAVRFAHAVTEVFGREGDGILYTHVDGMPRDDVNPGAAGVAGPLAAHRTGGSGGLRGLGGFSAHARQGSASARSGQPDPTPPHGGGGGRAVSLKVNIIGLGIMGKNVARALLRNPRVTVTAAADVSESARDAAQQEFTFPHVYEDYRAMLDAERPGAVFIATPDWLHRDPVMDALERGIHVHVEKPLTTSETEAAEIVQKVRETGLKLQVSYNHRWLAPYYTAYEQVRTGNIGECIAAYARKNNPITVPTRMLAAWAKDSSPMWFQSAHDIDLVNWYVDDTPVRVSCEGVKKVLKERHGWTRGTRSRVGCAMRGEQLPPSRRRGYTRRNTRPCPIPSWRSRAPMGICTSTGRRRPSKCPRPTASRGHGVSSTKRYSIRGWGRFLRASIPSLMPCSMISRPMSTWWTDGRPRRYSTRFTSPQRGMANQSPCLRRPNDQNGGCHETPRIPQSDRRHRRNNRARGGCSGAWGLSQASPRARGLSPCGHVRCPRRRRAYQPGVALTTSLRVNRYYLFDDFLPFMDAHIIDHEYGGFMTHADRSGKQITTGKRSRYEGRGIWIYAHLYRVLAKEPKYLEVARKSVDFLQRNAPHGDGLWPNAFTREGAPKEDEGMLIAGKRYTSGTEVYDDLFIANGFAEYARASGEEAYRAQAIDILKKCERLFDAEDYAPAAPLVYMGEIEAPVLPGCRPLGVWMVMLRMATQVLEAADDAYVRAVADRCVEAIMQHHYNPRFDLLVEVLNHDFSTPDNVYAQLVYTGHGIETLWMVMAEAVRRKDQALFDESARLFRRTLDVAWDDIYQGWYRGCRNVDENIWILDKACWVQEEALAGLMLIVEHTGAAWAKEWLRRGYTYVIERFPLKPHGYALWDLYPDRWVTFVEDFDRIGHFHHPRHLMLNLEALERMKEREGAVSGVFG